MTDTPEARGGRSARTQRARASRALVGVAVALFVAVLVVSALIVQQLLVERSKPGTGFDLRAKVLQETVNANPSDPAQRRELAFAYQQAGRYADARREYRRVLKVVPGDLASMYNLAVIDQLTNRPEAAEKGFLAVLAKAPTHSLAAERAGSYYIGLKKYDDALVVLYPAAEAHPDLADLQYLTGTAYEGAGQAKLAAARYRRALELVPTMTEAREGLARVEGAQ